eukprot:GFYU01000904.1.p1 GENE.GFYU01000904.1~~GFYU01000904.1.p1  ORF type:complete len:341 (-),score=124.09 GFYU01000904.1:360-1382(-)
MVWPFKAKSKIEKTYEIGQELGSGSFATVRKCRHKSENKEYAVKVISKASMKKASEQELLDNEVDILRKCDHPNILHLKETYNGKRNFYIVTELLSGGDVFDRIEEIGHITEQDAADLARALLDGLSYIHAKDIVHRDLKPENLLMSDKTHFDEVKLADFGLSKLMDNDQQLKTACGTPHYIAPEILDRAFGSTSGGYGPEVDMWSAGVILYIVLCGYPPFHHDNTPMLFKKIRKGKFEFPSPEWDHVSDSAKDLLRSLMEVNVSKRITAEEALDHDWLRTEDHNTTKLHVGKGIKKFNNQRKWKRAINAVMVVKQLQADWGHEEPDSPSDKKGKKAAKR